MTKPGLVIDEKGMDLMDRATYLHFITGLAAAIRDTGLTQEKFAASANTSETNLSRVLNDKGGCSPRWRKNICAALQTTESDVIARGHRETAPFAQTITREEISVSPAQVLSGVADIIERMRVTEEKLRFWKDIFEYLPTPICLLRGGIVLYHNKANRDIFLGTAIGQDLCQSCAEKGYNEGDCLGCMIKDTMETGHEATFHREIQGKHYVVTTSFITVNDMSYQLVLSTQVDRCEHWNAKERANDGRKESKRGKI